MNKTSAGRLHAAPSFVLHPLRHCEECSDEAIVTTDNCNHDKCNRSMLHINLVCEISVLLYFPVNSVPGLLRFARNDEGYFNSHII